MNEIPYVSDLITIGDYTGTKHKPADYNTAGYDRKYPIFMRQMGSLLTLKADYAGTDKTGDSPPDPGASVIRIGVIHFYKSQRRKDKSVDYFRCISDCAGCHAGVWLPGTDESQKQDNSCRHAPDPA